MGPVIDSHCHIFPGDFPQRRSELLERDATFAELFSRGQPRFATAESLIEAMDRGGIDWAVAMGVGWNDKALARESNDYLMESAAAHPGRLSGLCSVNPVWGEAALEEMERCAAGGLIGVGELHPDTQGFALDDPDTLAPLMELAGRLDWPALVHCSEPAGHDYPGKGSTTPGMVYRFISQFPRQPDHLRPLGRRVAFLRVDARGPGSVGERLFRHRGHALPIPTGCLPDWGQSSRAE